MKKILLLSVVCILSSFVIVALSLTVGSNTVKGAGGYLPTIGKTVGSPAPADGVSTITIGVYPENGPFVVIPDYPICLNVSGSGNTLSSNTANTGSDGYTYFTIKSTVAETKTINFVHCTYGNVQNTGTVTFTVPPPAPTPTPAPSTTTNTSTSRPSSTTPSTTTTQQTETKPLDMTQVQINSQPLAKVKDTFTTTQDKPIVFTGTTIPNGIVTIYVYSQPKKFSVTADAQGKWTLSVIGLPVGNHHAEAEVTDPTTKKTSSKIEILKFAVKEAEKTQDKVASTTAAKRSNGLIKLIIIVGVLGVGAVLATAYIFIKKKRQQSRAN
ncbi:hypothetical protein A3F37_01025 [Candidatus Saccharibacteria bacterium RIFCSPHIGHO2_12_FULL_41_12]|nr:MAG: hypothetical protein A3F37_01025 [Candidatus Saccharibacteria bacterium RIFCSPHIGHO2_12_FULL_41_12]